MPCPGNLGPAGRHGRFVATALELFRDSDEKLVEASCGECQFGLEGVGCDLAVRTDGKAYYVDGATMSDLAKAHGEVGMCNTIRFAKVKGSVINGRSSPRVQTSLSPHGKSNKEMTF